MAHIKLLDPFKKELRDMVVYTLAEFGATSVKRFNKDIHYKKNSRLLLAGIRLMKKKPWLGLKLLRKSMRMGNILMLKDFRKNCKKKLKSLFLTKNGI